MLHTRHVCGGCSLSVMSCQCTDYTAALQTWWGVRHNIQLSSTDIKIRHFIAYYRVQSDGLSQVIFNGPISVYDWSEQILVGQIYCTFSMRESLTISNIIVSNNGMTWVLQYLASESLHWLKPTQEQLTWPTANIKILPLVWACIGSHH